MEDLIIIALFLLASLASFINKQRQKRKTEAGEEEEQPAEFDWKELVFEQETEDLPPTLPYESQRPEIIPEPEEVSYSKTGRDSEGSLGRNAVDLAPELPSELDSSKKSGSLQTKPQPTIATFEKFYESPIHSLISSNSHRKAQRRPKIGMKSNVLLRQAIIAREILDRPRAYDT